MYSQNAEEQYILKATADLPEDWHRFLDIGACHPTALSNTRALYERGWGGVMIEPAPRAMETLIEEYGKVPRIALVQAVVAGERGLQQLHIYSDALSTTKTSGIDEKDHWRGDIYVPFITIADLFNQFGGGYGFINIDAEGTSVELAMGLLALTNTTPCICVEYDGDNRGLLNAMTAAGYKLVYSSQENGVFAK